MKKVCFLMATPFSYGGEQRVVSVISNLLIEKGYDVTILCTDIDTPRNNKLYNLNDKVKIEYLRGFNNKIVFKVREKRWKMFVDNLYNGTYKNSLSKQKFMNCGMLLGLLLIRAINKGKYDYVISVSTFYNMMLACVSKKVKAKTIGWQHSSSERYFNLENERHYNQDKFTEYMFKNLDSYVVLTNYDKKWLKEKFNVDTQVINNPKSIISSEVSNLKNKKFLAVGRFDKVKNFSKLIDMFYEFHKKNKNWTLTIVGEGSLKEEYLKKIKELKLEKYVTIDNFTNNIDEYYLNSSVYLMSSLYEGWGMVIAEAIEFGLPIISFNISSAPEMIKDNYNGYIIDNYDYDKYVECMYKLSKDTKLLKEFGKNSKKISNSKNNEIIINEWINLFEKLK